MVGNIRKRYVEYVDAWGKRHREHIADGICQECGKAEGIQIGDKIRCPDCVDKIIKRVRA